LLGAYLGGKLRYVGKVGTGFNEDSLASISAKLRPLARSKSSFSDLPRAKDVSFVQPKLVAQISYHEMTTDKKLRQAVFLGLRDDKDYKEVKTPEALGHIQRT
jgi:bifunctional non-homologous end joining protein LigD